MSAGRLGRGFADLPIEEQVRVLRDHALAQELVIALLFDAVKKLGVDFVWPDEGGPEDVDQATA